MTSTELLPFWATWGSRGSLRNFKLFMPAGLLLALLQPFDTGDLPFVYRFGYWALMMGACAVLMAPGVRLTLRLAEGRTLPSSVTLGLACAVIALPIAALVHGVDLVLARQAVSLLGAPTPPASPELQGASDTIFLYVSVFLVTGLIVGGVSLILLRTGRPKTVPLAEAPGIRFLSRLPPGIGIALVCIQVEDHYLRVTTRGGEALILMRFREALNELAHFPGFQVHRSWWVASREIVQIAKAPRRRDVVLTNGMRVPISASYRDRADAFLQQRNA